MHLEHHFAVESEWLGNQGTGTSAYKAYGRQTAISSAGKHTIEGSAARPFHGNAERWNPEELLIAALSECHMLSYLHVALTHGIIVTAYTDGATGTMEQTDDGGGHMTTVTLRPRVTISAGDPSIAQLIHGEAAQKCFIAASVNFPVLHEPEVVVEG